MNRMHPEHIMVYSTCAGCSHDIPTPLIESHTAFCGVQDKYQRLFDLCAKNAKQGTAACLLCREIPWTVAELQSHYINVHGELESYECPYCDHKTFRNSPLHHPINEFFYHVQVKHLVNPVNSMWKPNSNQPETSESKSFTESLKISDTIRIIPPVDSKNRNRKRSSDGSYKGVGDKTETNKETVAISRERRGPRKSYAECITISSESSGPEEPIAITAATPLAVESSTSEKTISESSEIMLVKPKSTVEPKNSHGIKLECIYCSNMFSRCSELVNHIRKCHLSKRSKCIFFPRRFGQNVWKLLRHICTIHKTATSGKITILQRKSLQISKRYRSFRHQNWLAKINRNLLAKHNSKTSHVRLERVDVRKHDVSEYTHAMYIDDGDRLSTPTSGNTCTICHLTVINLDKHMDSVHVTDEFKCSECSATFGTAVSLGKHVNQFHSDVPFKAEFRTVCRIRPKRTSNSIFEQNFDFLTNF